MTRNELIQLINKKQSFLCIGLDSDIQKIPTHLLSQEDPVFEFNRSIIDATHAYAVAYKPNLAFYESRGVEGWKSLEKTIQYINQLDPKPFVIADAKRGDIGNTAAQYAHAFFDTLQADAVTLSPYMGKDSITPFLGKEGKWGIILVLTSNNGAKDFQFLSPRRHPLMKKLGLQKKYNHPLFETVMRRAMEWGSHNDTMFVVGATKAEKLKGIRKIAPYHFLLVPGVGAQGGSLEEVAKYGLNKQCGLIVNVSRSIIFASNQEDFAQAAKTEAMLIQHEMARLLKEHRVTY